MEVLSEFYWSALAVLLKFYGGSFEVLRKFYGSSMEVLLKFYWMLFKGTTCTKVQPLHQSCNITSGYQYQSHWPVTILHCRLTNSITLLQQQEIMVSTLAREHPMGTTNKKIEFSATKQSYLNLVFRKAIAWPTIVNSAAIFISPLPWKWTKRKLFPSFFFSMRMLARRAISSPVRIWVIPILLELESKMFHNRNRHCHYYYLTCSTSERVRLAH